MKSATLNHGFKLNYIIYLIIYSSFDELVQKGVDFGRLLESHAEKTANEDNGSAPPSRATSRQGSITSLSSFMTNENNLSYDDPKEEEEARSSGSVGGWVYKGYFKAAGGCCTIFCVFILFVLSQFFASSGDFFVSEWVKMEENSVSLVIEYKLCKKKVTLRIK